MLDHVAGQSVCLSFSKPQVLEFTFFRQGQKYALLLASFSHVGMQTLHSLPEGECETVTHPTYLIMICFTFMFTLEI